MALRCASAEAVCDNVAPSSGQTATCDTSAPNPSTTGVIATPGSTQVTVTVLPGAEIDVSNNNAVFVLDQSTVVNRGTIRQTGDFFDAVSSQGTGAGHNVLRNGGTITTIGIQSEGIFNNAAAATMVNEASGSIHTMGDDSSAMSDFQGPGGSTLTNLGQIVTTGANSYGMIAGSPNDTLTNNGTIDSTGFAGAGLYSTGDITGHVAFGAGTATLINTGTIRVSGEDGAGIVTLNIDPVVATNNGTISATGPQSVGAFFNGPVHFTNGAAASIVAPQSNGVIANAGGTFRNDGTIQAFGASLFVGGPASIVNTGTIESTGYIAVIAQGSANVSIVNSGRLSGVVAAVQTDEGNDTFAMSAGTTSGIVNLGGGANAVVLTGGTVGGGIVTSAGATDTLAWSDGGVVVGSVVLAGSSNIATLTRLTDANLSQVTRFASGDGTGALTFDASRVGDASRFVNWTTINLTNASALSLDERGITLGSASMGGGTLHIDASSTLYAGGFGDPSIEPAVAGQRVNVDNAGTIDLTNGGTSTSDTLVIDGNYTGSGARLLLQAALGGDAAPSDRLVMLHGTASGSTALSVTNVGGKGGLTLSDGTMVVEAASGATTSAGAFSLSKPIAAGAYVYYLFKGGVTAGTNDNWYLRSSIAPLPVPGSTLALAVPVAAVGTPALPPPPAAGTAPLPLYRSEVPIYADVLDVARTVTTEQLDTFHARQGDQALLDEQGALPAAWSRAWGAHVSIASGGAASPEFDGSIGGIEIGHDVYANESPSGHRDHWGVFVGAARAEGGVSGFALGFSNYAAGHLAIDSYSLGGYWTHVGPGGWYTDTVLVGSTLTVDPSSSAGVSTTTHGYAAAASIEAGLPVPVTSNWRVEPQAQLIWQRESIGSLDDGISSVAFRADDAVIGRLGVRIEGAFDAARVQWLPYARVNVWRDFGGTDQVTYATNTTLSTSAAATQADFQLGLVARVSARGSLYANVGYMTAIHGPRRETVGGTAGVRWSW